MILAEDSSTQEEAMEKLTMWSGKLGYIHEEYFDRLPVLLIDLKGNLHYNLETVE